MVGEYNMRNLNFSDGFTSATEPSSSPFKASSIKPFPDDASYLAFKGSAAAAADIYFNTTDSNITFHDGTGWKKVVIERHLSDFEINTETLSGSVMTLQAGGQCR
jgi:hypothetical protein